MDTARASTCADEPRIRTSLRPIPLSAPELRGNEQQYLTECVETGWVSSVGPFVDRFERDVAAYVGSAHAVAMASGTAALHVALRIAGVEAEDEVIVSDLTFIAPVNAIRYCQAHPILVDAHPETWQLDVEQVARFLRTECESRGASCYNRRTGRRVRAILPVHILGLACEIDRITELAREHHLQVIEDAAESIGVRYRGRHVGTFGDFGVFSFNGNKTITTGGGGMLVTKNPQQAAYARYLTTQARDDALEAIHNEIGYNYRLTNIQAALGVAQLERIEEFIARKRAIARAYDEAFKPLQGITPMPRPPHTQATSWLYTLLLPKGTTVPNRRAFIQRLHASGIGSRLLWHPIHGLLPYRECQVVGGSGCATDLYARAVSLPSSVGLSEADLQRCVAVVTQSLPA